MKTSKKSMIILFSILAVIGITVGGWSMHQYQQKQEMISIATSDEARKVYEEYLKKEDPKALTEEGIIKSYEIDEEKLSYNPMGGLMVRLFLNENKDLRMNFNLIDNGDGTYSTAYYGYSGELNKLLKEKKMNEQYVNDKNLQIAMTEYDSEMDLDHVVKTQSGEQIGTVTQVYNNTAGAGEQVYAVVKNPDEKAEDVEGNCAIL